MDLEIKKNITSNWFKILQNTICDSIIKLEKNKVHFRSTTWKRNPKKNEGGGESLSHQKILSNGIGNLSKVARGLGEAICYQNPYQNG